MPWVGEVAVIPIMEEVGLVEIVTAQHTVIYTVPAVSQFWTYKPEDFLKEPVYSRDYPPCKNC
jgi:hypothetical protein